MVLLVLVVGIALAFDFTNGFHDTANYVATWVGTRALSPRPAVLISAAANLAGAFVTTAVATTVGKGLINTSLVTQQTVLAALFGAIAWNLITWRAGLPSSSTHALIGGLIGAALVQSGTAGVQWSGLWHKVIVPGALSPVIGFAGAFALLVLIYWLLHRLTPGLANRGFRTGQLFSGTWVAFTHGANDAQKTMGVIALALYTHGSISSFYIPNWVKITAGLTIAAGTYVGGWRIIRTLGQRIYKMQPEHGFAAQIAAGTTLYAGTRLGFPISTTHVVSGSVMGAGATRRLSAVRWGVARKHRRRLARDPSSRRPRRSRPLLPRQLDLLSASRSLWTLPPTTVSRRDRDNAAARRGPERSNARLGQCSGMTPERWWPVSPEASFFPASVRGR